MASTSNSSFDLRDFVTYLHLPFKGLAFLYVSTNAVYLPKSFSDKGLNEAKLKHLDDDIVQQ